MGEDEEGVEDDQCFYWMGKSAKKIGLIKKKPHEMSEGTQSQ